MSALRYWRVRQGSASMRVQALDIDAAAERAAACGFRKPDSVVLEEDPEQERRDAVAAWPMMPIKLQAPVAFDSLWSSEDARVRVVSRGALHYVSVDGDVFAGPVKSFEAAKRYGASIAAVKPAPEGGAA